MIARWRRLAELLAAAAVAIVAIVLTQALTPFFLAVAVPMLIVWCTVIHRGRQLRQSRMIRGLCTYCGYDLRATLDRCPECGESNAVPQ